MKIDNVLYIFNVSALNDDGLHARARERVTARRREKTDCFYARSDRNLSLGAGLLLDYGLRQLGIDAAAAEFITNGRGKPALKDHPEICFNLSHSGDHAVCAFSGLPVGCDIERIRPVDLKIARRCFSEEECAEIFTQTDEEQRTAAFFRVWTRRESYAKAVGLGLAEVLADRSCADMEKWHFSGFETAPDYRLTVCAESGDDFKTVFLSAGRLLN